MSPDEEIRQVSLSGPLLCDAHVGSVQDYSKQLQKFRKDLLEFSPHWPNNFDLIGSPYPLLVPESLVEQFERLGDILDRAVTNIVERWWIDQKANFPERMPLLPHQEELLQWIDGPGKENVAPFSVRKGVWRPDILLSANSHRSSQDVITKQLQICEINARFPFNGFFNTAFGHESHQQRDLDTLGLRSSVNPEKIFTAFRHLVDGSKPVHLIIGSAKGLDIHLFMAFLKSRYDLSVRLIVPGDLRLVIDDKRESGFKLCCLANSPANGGTSNSDCFECDSEWLEPIYQAGLELHQRELEALGLEILKALAPICFNDFRTIHLVHDKRMLGIIHQEIQSLVEEHKILSKEEADILKHGIVPTFIPGSNELQGLARSLRSGHELKDNFVLKLVGSGKGKGIVFGSDVTTESFIDSLDRLSVSRVKGQLYVVQALVKQAKFDIVVPKGNAKSSISKNFIVGTILMANGQQLGMGAWRTSSDRVCAVASGGSWMCSLVRSKCTDWSPRGRNLAFALSPLPKEAGTREDSVPRVSASKLEDADDMAKVARIDTALQKDGILIIDVKFRDPESMYLLNLVKALQFYRFHGPPLTHSSTRGFFWDVKPSHHAQANLARSETTEDFPWHTDCSYVSAPPRFFGLHVLQADRHGGGTLSVLQLSSVAESLDEQTLDMLCSPEFRIQVPPEFENGTDAIVGPLFVKSPFDSKDLRCRFRADIVQPLSVRAQKALRDLNSVLEMARHKERKMKGCLRLSPEVLPSGSIVLLDNSRWFHARNEVKDVDRHLRRIRWDAKEF